ncbi:MAG: ASKHA domain-containing protein, partial [Kiritimatiellaceae bacterium]|nr:ASKHA domain-containing protein [Kiritimatiellaceae bacterium]
AIIQIPARSLLTIGECSSADFYATRKKLFHPPEKMKDADLACLGIAVDIGTTTVAALLVDLSTGTILARESAYNRQIEMADNIASRIALCCEADNVLKFQQLLIEETLVPMFDNCVAAECFASQGQSASEVLGRVTQIVFSGNTVMSHLALGLSPLCIGTIPFEPITKVYSEHAAPELGLTCCPNATVRTVPSIAGYVGGDIVSDLYISELTDDGLELLVDIGTNGEIVLSDRGVLTATATAAGPAFEGAGLLHGARAGEGVIETITCNADDSIDYQTIGDKQAVGICGSAVVDFMASALKTGLLNQMGRFDLDRLRSVGRLEQMDCQGMNVNACIISPGDITITEFDISQIMKAKAAVYAGIRTLIERAGYQLADLDRLVLAGGFAAHLKIENAITIGLLPELPFAIYDVVGNGSLAGAYAALGASNVWQEFQMISERPESFHLADTGEFNDCFIDALALPNLDPDEFPKTMERL